MEIYKFTPTFMELFACVSGKVPTCHSDKHYFDYFDYILVRKPEYQIVLRCQYGSMDYYVHGGYACDWDDCKHETAKFILNGKEEMVRKCVIGRMVIDYSKYRIFGTGPFPDKIRQYAINDAVNNLTKNKFTIVLEFRRRKKYINWGEVADDAKNIQVIYCGECTEDDDDDDDTGDELGCKKCTRIPYTYDMAFDMVERDLANYVDETGLITRMLEEIFPSKLLTTKAAR